MRHRTKHNISASNTHHAGQRQNNSCSANKINWEVQKGELPSKQSTQSARYHMYKGTYVKGVKLSTLTICVLSLLLCSIGVMMYWYQVHTMISVFWQEEDTIPNIANKSEISSMSTDKKDKNTVNANESNQTPIKVQLPFIPLRDRADVHLSQNTMINFTNMESHLFDELDVIAFVLPPVIQTKISQIKLQSFLELGTRVAGTNREGHLEFLLRDALKQLHTNKSVHESSQTVASHEEDGSTLPMESAWWSLEWDNFTEDGPISFSNSHTSNNESSLSSPISFTNVIFTFAGGRTYIEQYQNQQNLPEEQEKKTIHSPTSTNTSTSEVNTTKRNHIVLAAHWDSKWQPIGLLGACDSAVPLLMLTRLMQNVATLSEMSAQLHAIAEEQEPDLSFDEYYMYNNNNNKTDDDCVESRLTHALRQILSPIQYHYLVEYYFGMSHNGDLVNNIIYNTNISNSSSSNRSTSKTDTTNYKGKFTSQRAEKQFLNWIKRIDALPPITIIMFDGEEAFEEWQGNDNTYGSRHLAARWRREQWQTPQATISSKSVNDNSTYDVKNEPKVSKYDSIALFVLLDLLGTRGAELHNFFPSFSGAFYKSLSEIERHGRQHALEQSIVMAKEFARNRKQQQHVNESIYTDMIHNMSNLIDHNLVKEAMRHIASHRKIPEIWHFYGAPHEMFTLFDFKYSEMKWLAQERAKLNSQKENNAEKEELLKRFSLEHTYDIMQTVKTPLNTSAKWKMLQELNRNVFFSREEAALHKWGSDDAHFTGIEDDHKHWLATERVLHLIAAPFPEEWHTLADNGSNIDHGTVVDVNQILWQFVLQLGKHVKY